MVDTAGYVFTIMTCDFEKLNMSKRTRQISKFAASFLLVLYGFVFLLVGVPDVAVKTLFLVIRLFYFVASFGIMKNRLCGFYLSALISIPGIGVGFFRVGQVLAVSGSFRSRSTLLLSPAKHLHLCLFNMDGCLEQICLEGNQKCLRPASAEVDKVAKENKELSERLA